MATFLKQLFKPKWQSNNAKTRLDAIKLLDPSKPEDQEALETISETDSDLSVAKAAIEKQTDTNALIKLHQKLSAERRPFVQQRLNTVAQSQSLTIFDVILDTTLLTELIINSDEPDTFITGIARIEEPDALANIATKGKTSRIRQAATELLESESQLNTIANAAKSKDKKVYQIAKAKLAKIKEQRKEQATLTDRIDNLLKSIEEHAQTENTQQYDTKLKALIQSWGTIAHHASDNQSQRFIQAQKTCEHKQNKLETEVQNKLAQAEALSQSEDERSNTLTTLEQTLDRFREIPIASHELASLDAIVKTQETRWIEATKVGRVEKAQLKHYQLLIAQMRDYLKSATTYKSRANELGELLSESRKEDQTMQALNQVSSQIRQIVKQIDWPQNFALPELIVSANAALGESEVIHKKLKQDSKEIVSKVEALMQKLDKSLEERQIKKSSDVQHEINQLLTQLGAKQSERFHNQLSLYANQLRELKDWQSYAAQPRQLELCEAMERLAELTLDPQAKSQKIKEMQKEWKQLGGASDQALWERFKLASDKAFEPCKRFIDEERQLKLKNIDKRKLIIEQVQDFVASIDWDQADWKAIDKINRKARQEWKDAYPVDFKANKSVQTRFNKLLKELDSHLDAERKENIKIKEDIVKRAQELAKSEQTDDAVNGAKGLQKEWQAVGITPHKQDRNLWREFRAACDQIFGQREAEKQARQEDLDRHFDAANAHISEIEAFLDTASGKSTEELSEALSNFRKQSKQLEPVGRKRQDEVDKKRDAALKSLQALIKTSKNKDIHEQWQEVERKATLCRKVYLQESGITEVQISEFETRRVLPSPMEKGLQSLWIQIKAGAVNPASIKERESARRHVIRCEVAAGLESPEEDREVRMQLQVSRLSEGLSSGQEFHTREAQLAALLTEWYQSVFSEADTHQTFEPRIQAAIEHIFA